MPLILITGEFTIAGAAPDGDSVRFRPSDPDAFAKAHIAVRTNHTGGTQLRLDGIDALETHYTPRHGGSGSLHQPEKFADAAADRLVKILGFTRVHRDGRRIVTSARPAATPGYILTRFADTYGRCVAFAFPGGPGHAAPGRDLSEVTLTPELLTASVNFQMITAGLAYPTYYSKLYVDLRDAMTDAVHTARTAGEGLWPADRTTEGFTVDSPATLTDDAVILPKLFRRLADYLALNDGQAALDGLPRFLATQDDRLLVVSEGRMTGFDNVIDVRGQRVALRYPPEDLVFAEK